MTSCMFENVIRCKKFSPKTRKREPNYINERKITIDLPSTKENNQVLVISLVPKCVYLYQQSLNILEGELLMLTNL